MSKNDLMARGQKEVLSLKKDGGSSPRKSGGSALSNAVEMYANDDTHLDIFCD